MPAERVKRWSKDRIKDTKPWEESKKEDRKTREREREREREKREIFLSSRGDTREELVEEKRAHMEMAGQCHRDIKMDTH
jgi:hypothetical protein